MRALREGDYAAALGRARRLRAVEPRNAAALEAVRLLEAKACLGGGRRARAIASSVESGESVPSPRSR